MINKKNVAKKNEFLKELTAVLRGFDFCEIFSDKNVPQNAPIYSFEYRKAVRHGPFFFLNQYFTVQSKVPEVKQGRSHGESKGANYCAHFVPCGVPLVQLRRFVYIWRVYSGASNSI